MNYFFVFQNKTYDKEKNGAYLWAPKTNKNGHSVSHWSNMANVEKGDLIIHSYNKKIVALSIANKDCEDGHQPEELQKENLWENNGFIVYSDYYTIEKTIITSDFKDDIVRLQPDYNKPFNVLGRGNTGYLFSSNKQLTKFIIEEIIKVQTEPQIISELKDIMNRCNLVDKLEREVLDDEELLEALSESDTINDIDELVLYSGQPQKKKELKQDKKGQKKYPRTPKVAANALKLANYQCESNKDHMLFKKRNSKNNYTEPHHLVPLSGHVNFDVSLDVEENIVSLCSHCHNLLHYGYEFEVVLLELYKERREMLSGVGINITFEELKSYY